MEPPPNRTEAERLLGIADKLLQDRDLTGSKEFAILAQETDPLLEGSDQILAIADVLLAAEKRINNHPDWYAVLQVDHRSNDLDLIRRQYRRLALLLHPDKNKYAWADSAFRLVADAWAMLSDAGKKSMYDSPLSLFSKVDLVAPRNPRGQNQAQFRREPEDQHQQQNKLPVRRSSGGKRGAAAAAGGGNETRRNFWTACPYCYNLYEYPKAYIDCCLRCPNCERAFHAVAISSLPPMVPGRDEYYCCWSFFPLGFATANDEGGKKAGDWTPPVVPPSGAAPPNDGPAAAGGFVRVPGGNAAPVQAARRKRGRPRKNA